MQALNIPLLVFILQITLFAQWYWQNPNPFGNALTEIQFLDNSVGYACGYGGTVIKTNNGGAQWFQLESETDDLIIDIFFISKEIGWFITYNQKTIFKTTNGGIRWECIGNFGSRYAHSLWFIDELNGYASGYQYLLSTTDGGSTWNEINSVFLTNTIFFLNSNIGFVSGFNVIYNTTNGGTDWNSIPLPTLEFTTNQIFALDQNKIFIVGTGYFQGNPYYSFLKTANGGNNWDGISFEKWLSDVYFKSLAEGCVISDKIYKTSDGGNTWQSKEFSISNFVFNDDESWAIKDGNIILHSNDFWTTSNQQIASVFSGFLWDGVAKDTNVIFGCGSNNTIVGSLDGGKNWEKYYYSSNQVYLNSLTFKNNEIWVVGEYGTVIYSKDNGSTWNESFVNATWLNDIEFLSDDVGYIVGTNYGEATIFSTQDGGNLWNVQQTFPEYDDIDRIEFARNDLGWLTANSYGLLKSTDSGRTWEVVVDSIFMFRDIAVSGDTAWFSYHNLVLKTTDAGNSWESYKVFEFGKILYWGCEIDFVSSSLGYAGTYEGKIFKTIDGGVTWDEEEYPSAMPIHAIDFVDSKRGWTFGDCGTILKRDQNNVSVEDALVRNPNNFFLSQNYPNPFNPSTSLQYAIGSRQFVSLKIYDLLGRVIATLVNEEKPAGEYEVEFDGSALTSGIYFYQLKAGQFTETRKMVLIK